VLKYVMNVPVLIARSDFDVQRVYEANLLDALPAPLTRDCIHLRLSQRCVYVRYDLSS
jgi:hypothetical protein